jgi:hypothetical protein
MAINYNEPVMFGRSGSAKTLGCSGIDFSEDGFESWTNSAVAEMDVSLLIPRQDVVFEIHAAPFVVTDRLISQNVFIFMAGFFIGYCTLTAPAVREFTVARNLISGRLMRLSLVIPTARSPHSLNISDDLRELGLHLRSITFKV